MNNSEEQEVLTFSIKNVDTIKELWSKTYNTEGKPDWSHILPYYVMKPEEKDCHCKIKGRSIRNWI